MYVISLSEKNCSQIDLHFKKPHKSLNSLSGYNLITMISSNTAIRRLARILISLSIIILAVLII